MKSPGKLWIALWPIGLAFGVLDVALALTSNHDSNTAVSIALTLLLGWSFIVSGLIAWARRPDTRSGQLMVWVGFLWLANAFADSNWPDVFTTGMLVGALPLAGLVHLLITFPDGRMRTTRERWLVGLGYAAALLANLSSLFVDSSPMNNCKDCPANRLLIVDSHRAATVLSTFWDIVGLAFMLAVAIVLVSRWRAATAPGRRVLTPVYVGGMVSVLLVAAGFALEPLTSVGQGITFLGILAFATVPFLFLAGLLRTQLARTGAVRLIEGADARSAAEAEAGLRGALNDSSLRLLVWREDGAGYMDTACEPAACPSETADTAVSKLVHDGRPLAAVVHDPSLRAEPELLNDVLAAARLTLVQNRSIEAHRASEQRNRALLDAVPDDMFRIRVDGTYLDFHSHAPDNLQVQVERIVGANVRELMPDHELAEEVMGIIERVVATGESETTELQLQRRAGMRWMEARLVRSGEDEVIAMLRDVTDRKEAEDAIVRQRDFLRTVVNTASSIFCVVTTEGRIVRFNEACTELTGRIDDDTVRGRLFWEVFAPPDEAESMRNAFESERAGVVFEHRWAAISGERLLIEWSSTPLVDDEGESRRLIHGVDVTERERQEEELRERYTFLTTIARATPSMLAVIEADGRIGPDGVNTSFEQTLGWGDDEAVGRPCAELVAPGDESAQIAIAEAVVSGSIVERESVWTARDGRPISVAWSIRPLGELRGRRSYLVSGVDVTDQKRQQAELRRSRTRIVEAQAAERRRLERNLHDGAQQRLVSLSLALRLAQAKLSSDPDGAARLMAGASTELALALEELRELARGIHPAVLTDRGLAAALEALAQRATLPVELEAVPEDRLPGPVEAAAFYVVSESLANVAKYAHASVARVRVVCADGEAVVEVSDDGLGGADESRGSGLRGLADRLEALDGRLSVESPVGRGTVVRAVIPLAPTGATEPVRLAAERERR